VLELTRAHLRELWHRDDRVTHGQRRANAKEPPRRLVEASRVRDHRAEERVGATREWNDHRLRCHDHVEVGAQVALERPEASAEVIVRVGGQVARLRR
jgi:hypothetical protein